MFQTDMSVQSVNITHSLYCTKVHRTAKMLKKNFKIIPAFEQGTREKHYITCCMSFLYCNMLRLSAAYTNFMMKWNFQSHVVRTDNSHTPKKVRE